MRQLSPFQRDKLEKWFAGPQNGEDDNQWLRRMNSFLNDGDRQLIVEIIDEFNEKKRA
jgi:hypothetical protein